MDAKFIYAENAPENILAFTSSKNGGYSKNNFASFNCGIFTGDDICDVLKNIEYLKQEHSIDRIAFLKQVHGTKVLNVNSDNFLDVFLSEGDGLFTSEPNLALGVFTADCFPVFLAGKKHISALHCGWRGLNSGIIENALALFKDDGDFPEYAFIGPGICPKCYEIREDMVSLLNPEYKPQSALTVQGDGSYYLDLRLLVENALKANGIDNYTLSPHSTCCSGMFYSYRVGGGIVGRMLSVIMRHGQ